MNTDDKEKTDLLQDRLSESVDMDCERKEMIKRKYGVEDNHVLTKILEKFGLKFDAPMRWWMVYSIGFYHLIVVYAFLTLRSPEIHIKTIIWGLIFAILSGLGITAGAHRHWAHKSYKAKFPLKVILLFLFSTTGHNTLCEWIRDHRLHHKFTETDADPHNTKRGFFYAHCGWYMLEQHPDVKVKADTLDLSDVLNDPFVEFHNKYHGPLKLALCFALPTLVPVYFWQEEWMWSFLVAMVRYLALLHITWSTNSVAHAFGDKPYDKHVKSVENKIVAILSLGEGWHNYHHSFPWDYKTSELGFYRYNWTTMVIDMFAKIGWAYDLKQPSEDLINNTLWKKGDGTHTKAKEMASR